MFSPSKLNDLRQVAQNPAESEYVQALVTILVEIEHNQLESVEALHDAQGIDGVSVASTREERRDSLLSLANAVASGDLKQFWFEEVVSEHVEDHETAMQYAGMDADAWTDQTQAWAEMYRSKAPDRFGDQTDREIAEQHVQSAFGVSLDAFEREVVEYSRKEMLKMALASNLQTVDTGIQAATAHARQHHSDGGEA